MVNNKEWNVEYGKNMFNYKHHYNYGWKGTGHRKNAARAWDYNEFISFDGEGLEVNEPLTVLNGVFYSWGPRNHTRHYNPLPQPYVLLGNSKKERITNKDGLPTVECLEFLLESKVRHPNSIFVGYYFNYDTNQILRDLPEWKLRRLQEYGQITYRKYWIKWLPRKALWVKHQPTQRSMVLYDSSGFFQKAFIDTCISYLGEDDPQLSLIRKGKESREQFKWEELEDFIIPYNDAEMEMHVRIMNILREDLHSVDAVPGWWHGPGAVANKVFKKYHVPISRETPEEVLDASQYAYAGGRFELLQMGRHPDTVYEYDIHSAYPAAATDLPDISQGSWETVSSFEPFSFGLWHVEYSNYHDNWFTDNRPQPLFCRSRNGSISYPNEVEGWYWTPEARLLPSSSIREGYVFRPTTTNRPFAFVKAMYNERRILQSQGSSTERALKLILNSIYGKMAQTVGGDENTIPTWHQLEYAGYITSYTRAKIYEAALLNPDAIIATETDAVFSTEPLDLPLSDELGDWEETIFDEICYLQSGFYYAMQDDHVICKYRGMDKDRNTGQPQNLPYDKVLEALWMDKPSVRSITTRFIGLAAGLHTKSVWRSWEKKDHTTHLYNKKGKRIHNRETCAYCDARVTMYGQLHPLEIGGYEGKSYPSYLPWRNIEISQEYTDYLLREEIERWG